jgi:hypothetical protein
MRMDDLGGIEARFLDFSCFFIVMEVVERGMRVFQIEIDGFLGEDDEISKNPRIWRDFSLVFVLCSS